MNFVITTSDQWILSYMSENDTTPPLPGKIKNIPWTFNFEKDWLMSIIPTFYFYGWLCRTAGNVACVQRWPSRIQHVEVAMRGNWVKIEGHGWDEIGCGTHCLLDVLKCVMLLARYKTQGMSQHHCIYRLHPWASYRLIFCDNKNTIRIAEWIILSLVIVNKYGTTKKWHFYHSEIWLS